MQIGGVHLVVGRRIVEYASDWRSVIWLAAAFWPAGVLGVLALALTTPAPLAALSRNAQIRASSTPKRAGESRRARGFGDFRKGLYMK